MLGVILTQHTVSASWVAESYFQSQVVPVCSGVSLLFLSELRSMQRHIEARAWFADQSNARFQFFNPLLIWVWVKITPTGDRRL